MAEASQSKTSAKGWLVFIIIFAYSITVCMGWFNLTGTSVKYAMAAANFSTVLGSGGLGGIGYAMSAVSLTALVMAFPAGWFIRKWGARNVIMISMVFSIIGCAIVAASGINFYMFMAGRVISGVGVGLCGVSCTTLTSLWIADRQKGLALAIWGIWVPVGMIIVYNIAGPIATAVSGVDGSVYNTVALFGAAVNNGDVGAMMDAIAVVAGIDAVWWVIVALFVVELIATFFIVRDPEGEEATEVSTERVSYSDPKVKSAIMQPQLWFLCVAWLAFNFCNYAFTNYMSTWFQNAGWSWSSNGDMVALMNTLFSACGIIAPFFGIVYDHIQRNKKWLFVSFGALSIALMCVAGFKAWGEWTFYMYAVFQVLGNCIMIAGVRPYIPLLVGRGGATAVSFGFALITFLQQLGNTLSGIIVSAAGGAAPATMEFASMITIIPVGIIGFICTLFIRLPQQAGGPQGGGAPHGGGKPEAKLTEAKAEGAPAEAKAE